VCFLHAKKDKTALVGYAPRQIFIPPDKFINLNNYRNVMVTNFRGGLLNDIVVRMITTIGCSDNIHRFHEKYAPHKNT
jgi:hypothetical protein